MWAGSLAQKRQALVYVFCVFTSRCWIVARNGGARSDQKWKKVRTLVGLPRYFPRCFFATKNGYSNLGEAKTHNISLLPVRFSVSYEVCVFNFLWLGKNIIRYHRERLALAVDPSFFLVKYGWHDIWRYTHHNGHDEFSPISQMTFRWHDIFFMMGFLQSSRHTRRLKNVLLPGRCLGGLRGRLREEFRGAPSHPASLTLDLLRNINSGFISTNVGKTMS